MITPLPEHYRDGYYQETSTRHGSFGIRVYVTGFSREFTQNDRRAFLKAGEILQELMAESMRLDPAEIAAREKERKELLGLFQAPMEPSYEEIPNGYCSQWCCKHKPWFRVLTSIGWVVIGWRKSVINIDWSETTVKATADELFANEEVFPGCAVTRIGRSIHAHGYTKAGEYVAKLLMAAHWGRVDAIASLL